MAVHTAQSRSFIHYCSVTSFPSTVLGRRIISSPPEAKGEVRKQNILICSGVSARIQVNYPDRNSQGIKDLIPPFVLLQSLNDKGQGILKHTQKDGSFLCQGSALFESSQDLWFRNLWSIRNHSSCSAVPGWSTTPDRVAERALQWLKTASSNAWWLFLFNFQMSWTLYLVKMNWHAAWPKNSTAKLTECLQGTWKAPHLDKVWKAFLAGRAGEIAIVDMNGHVVFEQIQAVKGLGTEDAGICFLVHVELHVALESPTVDEALVADVTSQRAVPFPPVEAEVLIQFVLFPEGLPTLEAFEGAKGFPDEEVLKSCILQETEPVFIIYRFHVYFQG